MRILVNIRGKRGQKGVWSSPLDGEVVSDVEGEAGGLAGEMDRVFAGREGREHEVEAHALIGAVHAGGNAEDVSVWQLDGIADLGQNAVAFDIVHRLAIDGAG